MSRAIPQNPQDNAQAATIVAACIQEFGRVTVTSGDLSLALGEGRSPLMIPVGSRLLVDLRHGGPTSVMVLEVIRTACGDLRCHLWRTSQTPERGDDPIPALDLATRDGGRVFATPVAPRQAGLLGRPL